MSFSNLGLDTINCQSLALPLLETALQELTQSYGTDVSVKLIGRLSKSPFLHLTHQAWANFSDISLCPSFYLIIKIVSDDETTKDNLLLQLVTYNGKPLQTPSTFERHELSDNVGQIVNQSRIFNSFLSGQFKLCKGLSKSAKRSKNDPDVLRDFVGERVVSRSRQCQIAVLKNDGNQQCTKCQNFSTEATLTDSPELMKSESDEVEDFDDYNTSEFLDHDDIRVISITSGLPSKLSRLSGISIQKSGMPEVVEVVDTPAKALRSKSAQKNAQTSSFPEPQVNLTVLVKDGKQEKVLPFDDFRKDLNIEQEREQIREPVLSKKRRKSSTSQDVKPSTSEAKRRTIQPIVKSVPKLTKEPMKNCPMCNKPFSDVTDFMKHLSVCDQAPSEEEDDTPNNEAFDESDEEYKPVLDNDNDKPMPKSLVSPPDKKKKVGKKPGALAKKKPSSGPVECTICMTTFKHDTNFPQHMKAHEDKIDINQPVECPVCSIEVESRKELNPHIKEHHPDKGGCCIECHEFMAVRFLN